jgi:hypothetical protein
MKIPSIALAIVLSAAFFAACATGPAPRLVYKEPQFANRLEYLRFCQRNALHDRRCD